MTGEYAIRLEGVVRRYGSGPTAVTALQGVDLTVGVGEYVALQGRSGSGKTTLLNVIGGLDAADEGIVEVVGQDLRAASTKERVLLRRKRLAFVFQAFGLLPILSAAENVEVPLRLRRMPVKERRERVAELLAQVGVEGRADHRPHEMSGGEQQRVAIARALANEPDLLIADEPTGQLDSTTGRRIMTLLREVVEERGLSMIVATHDPSMIADADRTVGLVDGRQVDGIVESMPTTMRGQVADEPPPEPVRAPEPDPPPTEPPTVSGGPSPFAPPGRRPRE